VTLTTGYWVNLATTDFERIDPDRTVALLPVGAVEQHGPHLPLGTDTLIADGIVTRALELVPDDAVVLALPTQSIGDSLEHTDFPGTLSHLAETLIAAWVEIGLSVDAAGIGKLMIFNAHGGQPQIVDIVAQKLRAELDMLVGRASYFGFGCPDGLIETDELAFGIHGGDVETSMMLHLHPNLVRRDQLADFPNRMQELSGTMRRMGKNGRSGIAWQAQDLNPEGVTGNAAAATADKGRQLVDHFAGELALRLADLADFSLDV
jgi:creatinine amidohydrolase